MKNKPLFSTINPNNLPASQLRAVSGSVMLVAGGTIYLAQSLHLNWLSVASVIFLGIFFSFLGISLKKIGIILLGGLTLGVGVGIYQISGSLTQVLNKQIGYIVGSLSISWFAVFLAIRYGVRRFAWWTFLCGCVFGAIALGFYFDPTNVIFWLICVCVGIGFGLLGWGISSHYIGLIIPGSLLLTIGPGIYFAWNVNVEVNPLSQTGLMLFWFSLGWFLITLISRLIIPKFIWWPLIPGGILAVVGIGLSIGGNPSSAFLFISNSGSIALIIFGLYLLLMKMGIRK